MFAVIASATSCTAVSSEAFAHVQFITIQKKGAFETSTPWGLPPLSTLFCRNDLVTGCKVMEACKPANPASLDVTCETNVSWIF